MRPVAVGDQVRIIALEKDSSLFQRVVSALNFKTACGVVIARSEIGVCTVLFLDRMHIPFFSHQVGGGIYEGREYIDIHEDNLVVE